MSTSLGRSGKIEIRTGSSVEDWAGIMDAAGLRDMTQNERVQRLLPLLQDRRKAAGSCGPGASLRSTDSSKSAIDCPHGNKKQQPPGHRQGHRH
ncbi:hypothetical protein [Glutamicibacter sp.]|uniref:hypothetical protein n=1 Tax=Glutamicibacter sp. TaxID=1931995 RepID=UPI002FCA7137